MTYSLLLFSVRGGATIIQKSAAGFDWTLPSKDYRDPALFERERRRGLVFLRLKRGGPGLT